MANITLEIRYANRPSEVRQFTQPKVTIGRESGHVILGDPQASSVHAEINVTQTHVTYVDLNSTNGSYLNGQRVVQPMALTPGSAVQIGSSVLVLVAFDAGPQLGPRGTLVIPQTGAGSDDPWAATFLADGGAQGRGASSADIPPPRGSSIAEGTSPSYPGAGSAAGAFTPPQGHVPPPGQFSPPAQPSAPQFGAQSPPVQPHPAQQFGAQPPAGASPHAPPQGAAQGQVPPPGYGPPGAYPPGYGSPGAPPPGYAGYVPPGALSPGYPHAGPFPGQPGPALPSTSDPIAFAKASIEAFQPHWLEAAKVIGILALPLGLLNAVSGYVPLVGWLFALLGGFGYGLAYMFFGLGAQAEYALRLAAGAPASAAIAWRVQLGRMFPWFFGLFVPLLIASIGCIITAVLFGLFLLPVYMIENKRMFDANQRSFQLASKDWGFAILPVLIVAIPAVILNVVVTVVLSFVPYVGGPLAALWGPLFGAVLTPLLTFIQFRVYFALVQKHEGVDAAAYARQQLA